MIQPTAVLNLERGKSRKALMSKQLDAKGIPYFFFPAFDGKDIINFSVHGHITYGSGIGRKFNPAEIAITNGHMSVIKHAEVMNYDHIIILEDDIVVCDDWNKRINWILENVPEDWDYIYLSGHSDYIKIPIFEEPNIIKAPKMVGAFSYIVNKKAYSKITKFCSSYITTYDDMIMHMIDLGKINGYLALPFLTFHDANESMIWQEDPLKYKKNDNDHHSSYKYFRNNIL